MRAVAKSELEISLKKPAENETQESQAGTRTIPPKTRVLTAACDLFYKHGIHAVSMDAIAEAASTNKMTVYRHFPSKDVLVWMMPGYVQSGTFTEMCWEIVQAD